MKMSKKMKIISMVAIGMAAILTIACANVSSSTIEPTSTQQWQKKYPQVFSKVGYSKLIESQGKLSQYQNIPESTQELIGTITNQFGIRDDVLSFTFNYFQGNESATIVAIKLAQIMTNLYLTNNQKDARNYYDQMFVAGWCLWHVLTVQDKIRYTRTVEKYISDTPARKEQSDKVDGLLSGGIYGYGNRTNADLKNICNKGNY